MLNFTFLVINQIFHVLFSIYNIKDFIKSLPEWDYIGRDTEDAYETQKARGKGISARDDTDKLSL